MTMNILKVLSLYKSSKFSIEIIENTATIYKETGLSDLIKYELRIYTNGRETECLEYNKLTKAEASVNKILKEMSKQGVVLRKIF